MRKHVHKLSSLGAALAVLVVSGSTVMALPPQAQAHAQAPTSTNTTTGQPTDPGSQAGTRLADARLKSCQNREKAINNITSRIVTRGTNQLNLFNTIAQRVEAFKTSKNVTVANYDQLVATLQTDQTQATNDLAAMKTNATLDCTSSDPKGMISAFQSDMKTEISDMQTYRTDVKNLIVAVKTAVGSTGSTDSGTSSNANSHASTGGNQ